MRSSPRTYTLALAALLATASCASSPLPSNLDGGGNPTVDATSGPPMNDLRGGSCADVAGSVSAWLAANQTCTKDSDCQVVYTSCGLQGDCGTVANHAATGAYLSSLLDAWTKMGCHQQPCICPLLQPVPSCNKGGFCGSS